MAHLWIGVLLAGLCVVSFAAGAQASPPPTRALVLTQSVGYVHEVVKPRGDRPSVVEAVLRELARESKLFEPTFVDDAANLTESDVRAYGLFIFYTTGELPLSPSTLDAMLRAVEAGDAAFLGIHCATDTLKDNASYTGLVGGVFDGHPWNANETVTVKANDPTHPAAMPYAPKTIFQEEIYQFRQFDPTRVRTLLSLDMPGTELKKPYHVPIAWCRQAGDGRVFYTSLGHRPDVWESDRFQRHLTAAIAWLVGVEPGSAEPNPATAETEARLAREAAGEPVEHNTLSEAERAAGWRLLFDGRTTEGWRGFGRQTVPEGWQVRDGALVRVASAGDIATVDQFDDFELRIDWKISPGGNSGIFFRVSERRPNAWETGPEFQVLDDGEHRDGGNTLTSAGSNYALHAPAVDATRPVGEFNVTRILVRGDHVEHHLNGVKLLEYELGSDDWKRRVAESKFASMPDYGAIREGHIVLQDHGDEVWYRNIKIRELSPSREASGGTAER